MADQKLSQLTAATTPLTGTESLYAVQSGNSRKTTAQAVANLAPGTNLSYTAGTRTLASSTGDDVVLPEATTSAAGLESAADKTKLDSITVDTATVVRKYVRNNSGVPIPKGAAVYQTGSSGTTLTVALADASAEATAAQTLGLAQEAIAHNSNGYIVAVGLLDGISTATLTEGQIVWLSETAGEGTTTRPTQPAHGVVLGYCVKQSAGTAGILYVKVDNGLELEELHDVLISGAATDQALVRASDGLWKNRTIYSSSTPAALGTAAVGTGSTLARADHVHAMPSAADVGAATSSHVHGNITNAGAIGSTSGLPVRTGTGGVLEAGSFGTTSGTFAQGNDARFHDAVSLGASVADVLDLTGQVLAADDPGADRLVFWDDSAGKLTHLTTDSALLIDGTTLRALSTLVIPLTGEATSLTQATLLTVPWWPEARVLTALPVWMLNTAATGSAAQFDIRVGGTSIFATLPTIDATEASTATAATAAVFSTAFISGGQQIAQGSSVTFHCTQVGATVAGAGLKVALPSRRAS
jgi:hypothetical protein